MKKALLLLAMCCLLTVSGAHSAGAGAGHWAEVNGHRLYYERYGSGRPLVLLHGGGETIRSSFSEQLALFSKHHEVIAPEQVGQGHTPDISGPLTYTAMMEDTAALLKQLHIADADVVGWSDGGNLALMLAVRHPELVRRLVVSGANMAPDGMAVDEIADTRESLEKAEAEDPDGFSTKLLRMWMGSPTLSELSIDLLRGVHKPVLVMSGDHDAIRLQHTFDMYHALPQGQLFILPDTGHATFSSRPEWVNPVVMSFLEGDG